MADTCCKMCAFAEYDGITQTSCAAGMLDRFKAKGADIVEAFDQDREFYVISERVCCMYRTPEWAKKHPWDCEWQGGPPSPHEKEEDIADDLIRQQISQAKQEIKLEYQVIVFVDKDNEAGFEKTIESLTNQTIKPQRIVIIRSLDCSLSPKFIINHMSDKDMPWRMQTRINDELPDGSFIDIALDNMKTFIYGVFYAGDTVDSALFANIKYLIFEELEQFAAILPPEGKQGGLIIPYVVHAKLQGNAFTPLTEKIKELEWKTIPLWEVERERAPF